QGRQFGPASARQKTPLALNRKADYTTLSAARLCGCLCDDLVRMQPHGISASISTPISESATFVNVMAFLHPCTAYSRRVTHSDTSHHEKIFNQATSSSVSVVSHCGSTKPASTVDLPPLVPSSARCGRGFRRAGA